MPDQEIIHLPAAGSIPGFPGSHGPGAYEVDYTTRTLRRVVDGVPVDEPAPAPELYVVDLGGYAAAGGLEVLPAPAPDAPAAPSDEAAAEPASVSPAEPEATPAPAEAQPEPEPAEPPAAAEEAQPEPSEPAPDEAHE